MSKKIITLGLITATILSLSSTKVLAEVKLDKNLNTLAVHSESKEVKNGWEVQNGNWVYYKNNIKQIGWVLDGNTWYYMNNDAVMQTGWLIDSGNWYYMNQSGAMQTGWVFDNGSWYYLNSNGVMATGWVKIQNEWYYLNNSGVMQTGWLKDNNNWYYLYSSGVMATNTEIDNWVINNEGLSYPKSEKVYTGSSVKNALAGLGFNSSTGAYAYVDYEYGYGEIASFYERSGEYDMQLSIYRNPPEMNEVVQSICNTVLPGHGGTLYNAINSGVSKTINIGGRTIEIVVKSQGTRVMISPING